MHARLVAALARSLGRVSLLILTPRAARDKTSFLDQLCVPIQSPRSIHPATFRVTIHPQIVDSLGTQYLLSLPRHSVPPRILSLRFTRSFEFIGITL